MMLLFSLVTIEANDKVAWKNFIRKTLLSKKNWDCAVVRMFSTESES